MGEGAKCHWEMAWLGNFTVGVNVTLEQTSLPTLAKDPLSHHCKTEFAFSGGWNRLIQLSFNVARCVTAQQVCKGL